MTLKHIVVPLLCLALMLGGAYAQETTAPVLKDNTTTGAMESTVSYPSLEGTEASEAISQAIYQNANMEEYLNVLAGVTEGATGLQMSYEALMTDHYLSLVFSANGRMITGRPSQVYYPMNFNLQTGEALTLSDVFTDADAAVAYLESYLEETVEPDLSTYLENRELLPLPVERFSLSETSITFYYENSQLSFLSGYSGAVSILYQELKDYIDWAPGGVVAELASGEEGPLEMITRLAAAGCFPSRSVFPSMNDNLNELFALYRQTIDSGYYPGGEYYELEDARYRGTYIVTDEQAERVTGIISTRCDVFGLVPGITTQAEWRGLLGEPAMTFDMTSDLAQMYLLEAGSSDYYAVGDHQLIFHADANGILYAVILN